MIFDLHIHTTYGSADSFIEPDDVIEFAKQAKLDGVCITEHGYKRTGVIEKISNNDGLVIVEGIEFTTELGDVLIYGVDDIPKPMILKPNELREFVIREGGIMFVAHPFRQEVSRLIRRGQTPSVRPQDVIDRPLFGLVDGLEIANGYSVPEDVAFCKLVSEQTGLKGIGGSDAHVYTQIGDCVTVFENSIHSETELIAELKRGAFYAEDRRQLGEGPLNWWFIPEE